jgi:hypothetical protein
MGQGGIAVYHLVQVAEYCTGTHAREDLDHLRGGVNGSAPLFGAKKTRRVKCTMFSPRVDVFVAPTAETTPSGCVHRVFGVSATTPVFSTSHHGRVLFQLFFSPSTALLSPLTPSV